MHDYKLNAGFLGAGIMGGAIINRVLDANVIEPKQILVYDTDFSKLKGYHERGARLTTSAAELFFHSDIVFICVKPQNYKEILSNITEFNCSAVVSIMAGVKIAALKEFFGGSTGVARVMPNMPCAVGKGMSAVCFDNVKKEEREFIIAVLESCGDVLVTDESKFDAVTSISGSGPAYVYAFADAMLKGGMTGGLTYEESRLLTLKTLEGAAAFAAYSGKPLDEMITNVCSKGGTTIEAIDYFNKHKLGKIIEGGVKACRDKSVLLSGDAETPKKEAKKEGKEEELPDTGGYKSVEIYTDGACTGNPGPGGFCAILKYNGKEKIISGGEQLTTNNRMEMKAVLEGLRTLKEPCRVSLYSDSAYVINAFTQDWLNKWMNSGWKRESGVGDIKNIDLWKELYDETTKHKLTFIKVKGHSDNEDNNRCDKIAREEIKKILSADKL